MMIKKSILFLSAFFSIYGITDCSAEKASAYTQVPRHIIDKRYSESFLGEPIYPGTLMQKMHLASIGKLSEKSNVLVIKQRTNDALLHTKNGTNKTTEFDSLTSLQDCEGVANSSKQEAPDLTKTKNGLSKNLQEHATSLVRDFFKTQGYTQVKENIQIFKNFIFSCPSWGKYKTDKTMQQVLESCSPENCFNHEKIGIEYVYDGENIAGICCTVRSCKEFCKDVTVNVAYSYFYLFERVEKRCLGVNFFYNQLASETKIEILEPYANILAQDVFKTPGHRLSGRISFVFKNNAATDFNYFANVKSSLYEMVTYAFSLCDAEKLSLKKDALQSTKTYNEITFDFPSAEISAFIDNHLFYATHWTKPKFTTTEQSIASKHNIAAFFRGDYDEKVQDQYIKNEKMDIEITLNDITNTLMEQRYIHRDKLASDSELM